jgi:hypothetical protein
MPDVSIRRVLISRKSEKDRISPGDHFTSDWDSLVPLGDADLTSVWWSRTLHFHFLMNSPLHFTLLDNLSFRTT